MGLWCVVWQTLCHKIIFSHCDVSCIFFKQCDIPYAFSIIMFVLFCLFFTSIVLCIWLKCMICLLDYFAKQILCYVKLCGVKYMGGLSFFCFRIILQQMIKYFLLLAFMSSTTSFPCIGEPTDLNIFVPILTLKTKQCHIFIFYRTNMLFPTVC